VFGMELVVAIDVHAPWRLSFGVASHHLRRAIGRFDAGLLGEKPMLFIVGMPRDDAVAWATASAHAQRVGCRAYKCVVADAPVAAAHAISLRDCDHQCGPASDITRPREPVDR